MNNTALTQLHREMGARIVSFAGFHMPLEYSGVKDEHLTVRNAVGVFDVSHMGEFWVKGTEAAGFVQHVTSNDIHLLERGKVQYSCLTNDNGGIVDDLLIYMFDEEKYLMVVNAANTGKDWDWLEVKNKNGPILENASNHISQLAVQGPRATGTLQKLCSKDLSQMRHFSFDVMDLAGVGEVIISATGYTGAGGFELYFKNDNAEKIWNAVLEAGKEFGIKPVGLAARDTLRLEMGFCLYGNDINETTTPIEAGLGWITRFVDNNPFVGRELLEKQVRDGIQRKLVGFIMLEKGIPRQHYRILNPAGDQVGEVTSGTMSPSMNAGIGLGYVRPEFTEPGTGLRIEIRARQLRAEVVGLPIYKKNSDQS